MFKIIVLLLGLCVSVPTFAAEPEDVQTRIFKLYLLRAQEGNMNSQFIVGQRYESGEGTAKDFDKAYEWYKKAADQGHPIAQQKLKNRGSAAELAEITRQQAAAEAKAREQAEMAARTKAATDAKLAAETKAREQTEAAARAKAAADVKAREQKALAEAKAREHAEMMARTKAAAEAKAASEAKAAAAEARLREQTEMAARAKAAAEAKAREQEELAKNSAPAAVVVKEPPAPTFDTLNVVLNGKWFRGQSPVEFLPSPNANCLRAGNNSIVCFSSELIRNVGASSLAYTVKATLSDFQNNGSFRVNYLYNVLAIDPNADGTGAAPETSDLTAKLGWQEPGITLDCRLRDERNLECGKDKKNVVQYSRR